VEALARLEIEAIAVLPDSIQTERKA